MFRRDFQLPRHVVLAEFAQETRRVLVGHDVVVAQAAADEHLLHLRQLAKLLEDGQKFLVINLQVLARLREQALPMLARADFQLIWTRRLAEIRRRAADIVNVALEIRQLGQQLSFAEDAFGAAALDDAPLMERDGAEIARAEASARGGNREFDLLQRWDAALCLVHRVISARVGQVVHRVEGFTAQRQARLILYQIPICVLLLTHALAANRVLLVVLDDERLSVLALVGADLLMAWQLNARRVGRLAHVADAAHFRQFRRIHAVRHPVCAFDDARFAHAVHQQRRTGVHQNAVAHLVVPVVIVGETAEARFHAADENRHIAVRLPDSVAVDDGRAVGAHEAFAAGGVGIVVAALFRDGIVVDHAVNHARGHQKAKPGLAELLERGSILPRRQTEHCHAIACLLQNAADNCQPERRVIYIRVAADIHKVGRIPAARVAFVQRHGQKSLVESIHRSLASLYHTLLLYCIGSRRNCQARFCFAKIRGIGRAISSIASATLTQPKPCSYSGSA